MKKIYIAGFDVFERDSIEIGKIYVKLCKKYGFEGLYPLDNVVDFNQEKHKIAKDIFDANVKMIQQADFVVANLNPFRGSEPDSGTVWECGYGYALGKKVYGYIDDDRSYLDRFDKNRLKKDENGMYWDENDMFVEDFDLPLNLMISCSATVIEGGFEDVLKVISET